MTAARDLVPRMRELRAEGYSAAAIGRRLGMPTSTVRNWWNAGACIDCGVAVEHSNAKVAERCRPCANIDLGLRSHTAQQWTPERIIAAVQWWVAEYGEPPAIADWNPNNAIIRLSDLSRARRGERLIAEGRIPWFTSVFLRFGSWNAAIEAAGFTPYASNGGGGNQWRRRNTRKPDEKAAA